MIRRRGLALLILLALVAAFAVAGCGGNDSEPTLRVSAAASLADAFTQYGKQFDGATVRSSFAGSDELAAQIRKSKGVDVYAAANTKLPEQLYHEGKVQRPTVFAGNRLVIAVKAGERRVHSIKDLERPGLKLVVGTEDVPVGSYTRDVLGRLPATGRAAITANFKSTEPDVTGITGKLTQGAADAGFLYATDVTATHGKLDEIELPKSLEPDVKYGVAVVKGTEHEAEAKRFIAGLLSGRGLQALTKAGFTAAKM